MNQLSVDMAACSITNHNRVRDILRGGDWVFVDCSFAGMESPDDECPIQIVEISFMFKKLPTLMPFTFVVHKPNYQNLGFGMLMKRFYELTGINYKNGTYTFEYVSNMFKDLCTASGTRFVFVKDRRMEETATALCQFAKGGFVPVIVNLEKEKILQHELKKTTIKPDFTACKQHDQLSLNNKWYCTQAWTQFVFNLLNAYVWRDMYCTYE